MSHTDSYGHEPRRSRRAPREPAGPSKVQGSTAAAILVALAIVGFGIGAVIGNAGGDDPDSTTAEDELGAATSPGTEQSADPDDPEGDDRTEGSTPSITITLEMDDSAPAGEELEYRIRTDPARPGLVLGVERRQPGGDWEPFGDPQLEAELGRDGEHEGHVRTGIAGEAEWRVGGEIDGQRVESNVVTATITEEEDDSGPGNSDDDDDD